MSAKTTPEMKAAAAKAARKKYPERARARNKVARAIQTGALVRPSACARCGVACKPEASHDDYADPLSVEWLCKPCHCRKDLVPRCPQGHEYSPDNTRINKAGSRECVICRRISWRDYMRRRRAGVKDLVDYLRDKLEHADDPTCTCPDSDTWAFNCPDHRRWAIDFLAIRRRPEKLADGTWVMPK